MPNEQQEPRERVFGPTTGEYKGHPTLTLPMPKARKDFTFGLSKARAIIEWLEAIQKFVADSPANGNGG